MLLGQAEKLSPKQFLAVFFSNIPGTIPKQQFACSHPGAEASSEAGFSMPAGLRAQECSQAHLIY